MSAKSRGYDEKLLDGNTAEFVMPDVLVEESIKADSVLSIKKGANYLLFRPC